MFQADHNLSDSGTALLALIWLKSVDNSEVYMPMWSSSIWMALLCKQNATLNTALYQYFFSSQACYGFLFWCTSFIMEQVQFICTSLSVHFFMTFPTFMHTDKKTKSDQDQCNSCGAWKIRAIIQVARQKKKSFLGKWKIEADSYLSRCRHIILLSVSSVFCSVCLFVH